MKNESYCRTVMDKMYEFSGDAPLPFMSRLEIAFHVLFCTNCAGEIARLENVRSIMRTDFLPPSPDLEDSVMSLISAETVEISGEAWGESPEVSFRLWVITGLIIFFSLGSSIFNMDFMKVAAVSGSSFLLPIGIIFGAVVTGYGAIFIGSHLKEFSDRFGLH
ncbi:MAG: peptidoglycan-binding protein [Treponema sp.]|jgi:hypothetical protein|nr:peptidoglycan-binding protein [Treponema sp.]